MKLNYTKDDILTIIDNGSNVPWSRLKLCQDWAALLAEVERLREENKTLYDRLTCSIPGTKRVLTKDAVDEFYLDPEEESDVSDAS